MGDQRRWPRTDSSSRCPTPVKKSLHPLAAPRLPAFVSRDRDHEDGRGKDIRAGLTVDVWLRPVSLNKPVPLVSSVDAFGRGIRLSAEPDGSARVSERWQIGMLVVVRCGSAAGRPRLSHVVAIVDGGPKIIMFVVDGDCAMGASSGNLAGDVTVPS